MQGWYYMQANNYHCDKVIYVTIHLQQGDAFGSKHIIEMERQFFLHMYYGNQENVLHGSMYEITLCMQTYT